MQVIETATQLLQQKGKCTGQHTPGRVSFRLGWTQEKSVSSPFWPCFPWRWLLSQAGCALWARMLAYFWLTSSPFISPAEGRESLFWLSLAHFVSQAYA